MKITDIAKKKGTRWQVDVDDAYWYILDAELILSYGLKTGLEVDEEFLAEVKEAAERRKARERAFYLLEGREHSKKELVDKLCRSVSYEIAEETALHMEELGLIHEDAYARRLAEYLINVKKRGERRVRMEMRQKGLDEELIDAAIDAVQPDEELLTALVRKKYARYLGDEKGKNKVVQALVRLGHSYYDALEAVEIVEEELEAEDEGED